MIGLGVVLALGFLPSEPAEAHAFLVATSPAQGERLAGPPSSLLFEFSEPVEPDSLRVELATSEGKPVDLPEPEPQDLDVRVRIGDLADGIYVTSWEATSAVDGHGSAGEFAFAVGEVEGALPGASATSSTSGWGLVATLLFVVGLGLSLGWLALRGATGADTTAGASGRGFGGEIPGGVVVRVGLLLAIAGVAVGLAVFEGGRWELVVAIELVAVALLLVALRRGGWLVPLGVATAAAGAWAARSHAATDHGVLGWLSDFVHLAVGAAWGGSLALVVVTGWRLRRRGRPWLPLVRRYARLAVGFVVALGVAGVVSAVQLVPTWADLWSTGYGRLVVTKVGVFGLALAAAAVARRRALAHEQVEGARRPMTLELAAVGAAVVVAGLLANGAPPLAAAATEQLLGPPPLAGDVVRDAGLAGQLNVEVVSDGERLDVDVFDPSGSTSGVEAAIALTRPDGSAVDLAARPCGPGCFTQALELDRGLSQVRVQASAPGWTGGTYDAALRWPPGQPAPERLAALVEEMRRVPELAVRETTSSGPGAVSEIGPVTLSGDRFIAAEPYAGANLDDVQLVDDNRLVLYLPGDQIYASLKLDDAGRLSSSRIVARGHEITREFTYPPGG